MDSDNEHSNSSNPNEDLTSSDDKTFHDDDDDDLVDSSGPEMDCEDNETFERGARNNSALDELPDSPKCTQNEDTSNTSNTIVNVDDTQQPKLESEEETIPDYLTDHAENTESNLESTYLEEKQLTAPSTAQLDDENLREATQVFAAEIDDGTQLQVEGERLSAAHPSSIGSKASKSDSDIDFKEPPNESVCAKASPLVEVQQQHYRDFAENNLAQNVQEIGFDGTEPVESDLQETATGAEAACCLEMCMEQPPLTAGVESLRESVRESIECFYSAQDFSEYCSMLTCESRTPDMESGYFEKSESDISHDDNEEFSVKQLRKAKLRGPSALPRPDRALSEGLRIELSKFEDMIKSIEKERLQCTEQNRKETINSVLTLEHNFKKQSELTKSAEELNVGARPEKRTKRGYWSTIFGEASQIETGEELTLDERFADVQKAHRALELLEDYHSRLSEPQDRALRVAIERVIRIFKSRLFQALLARDFPQAYRQQTFCVQAVVKMLQQLKDENWCLPVMYVTCLDLRVLAYNCESLGERSKPGEILEKSADCLMSCFRVCAADNRAADDDTKRLGMLYLVNQLFKVYFRINKLHLCKPLIRAIESSAFKDCFPIGEQTTYKYFVGRKAMFDSDYKSADECLSFAFKHCPSRCKRNKRLILIYLVPVKMLLGYWPIKPILERYDILQFHELTVALKEGNVRKFDEVIQRHEIFFIKCGIYLLVEKLKFIVYRNLFKRVYNIKQTHQLNLKDFLAALHFVGETDINIDETHCIVANLIFEGKIKGYISHSHNKLVVSKQNPFPPLNTAT